MSNEIPTTFADLGIIFSNNPNCKICENDSCHNNVKSKKNEREYNVHIQADFEKSIFWINAAASPSVDSPSDIHGKFEKEQDAVRFLLNNFEAFKCF